VGSWIPVYQSFSSSGATANRSIDKLTSGYDSVIIDKGTKQLVAKLLSLSASRSKPNAHPLLSQVQSRGAMFYGPPGTGKTHLCRAIAKESGMTMLAIDGANVISKWVGESEKYIRAAFTLAEKLHPCIVFLDEVDSLFGHRHSDQRSWERAQVTQFLKEMDGLSASDKAPFVIVATNRPGDLDEAFIRRLSHKVLFSLPTLEQRKDIFKVFLKDDDLSDDVRLDLLAAETEGFSGSDIRSLCGAAALAWSVEQSDIADASTSPEAEPASLRLTSVHFESAFERSMPSVSAQSMKDIESFEKRFSQKRGIGKRFTPKTNHENGFPAKTPFWKDFAPKVATGEHSLDEKPPLAEILLKKEPYKVRPISS
jgi:SpoVK/Ycf46/Vps4 family AAA+-type ATPase